MSLTESLLLPDPHPTLVTSLAHVQSHVDAMRAAATAEPSSPTSFPSPHKPATAPDFSATSPTSSSLSSPTYSPSSSTAAADDSPPPPPYHVSPSFLSHQLLTAPSPSAPFTSSLPHSSSSSSSLSSQRKASHTRYPSSSFSFTGFHRKHTPISLQFHDVSLTLPNGQRILQSVTGSFPHSRLIAIMGPSGAGKTSFLNVLAGRSSYARMEGRISINHIPCSISRLRSYAGFVPQDDILHPDLTVYENLYYSALLRLPASMKLRQKTRIIEDTIDMLGLDHIRNSRVGSVEKRGISGGQRKRVNIGTELVANPSLLFMDEPTSGLDASAALEVLSSLRRLADLGLTIITVVHQPRFSIFSSFHTVLFLGQGGQTVYLGRTEDAMGYFESLGFDLPDNENPADFLMDVISGVVRDRRGATDEEKSASSAPRRLTPAPGLIATTSIPALPQIAQDALNRTLSASQSLRNVASLIIDISEEGHDDRKEPVMDFAAAWGDHCRGVEEERRARKERSWSNASGRSPWKRRSNSNASTIPESPEVRQRSGSDASVDSQGSAHSDRSGGGGGSPAPTLGARVHAFLSKAERERQEKAKMDELFDAFASAYIDDDGEEAKTLDEKQLRSKYTAQAPPHPSHTRASKSLQGVEEEEGDGDAASTWCCFSSPRDALTVTLTPASSSSDVKEDDYHSLAALPRDHVFGLPTQHTPPSFLSQFLLLTERLTLKVLRNWTYAVVDLCLIVFLAAVVGWVYGSDWSLGEYTSQSVFSTLCIGVCATVASLRLFGQDRLVYWRESLVGVNQASYWCSLVLTEVHRAFLYPLVFVAVYLPLAKPQASFATVWGIFAATYFAMAGLGLLLSVICRPVPALMIGTMLPLVIGGFLSGVNPPVNQMSAVMAFFANFSFTRWAVEPIGMAEAKFPQVYGADAIYYWQTHFQFVDRYWTDIGVLVAMGVGWRLLTGLALRRFVKNQKG